MVKKHTLEYMNVYFENNGCKLIVDKYTNNLTKMPYICECGNESKICFSDFRQGKRCKSCGIKKRGDSHRYTFEFVKQYFEEQGCELLSAEYSGSKSHLDYICNCGKKSRTLFSDFRKGVRCKSCGIKKRSDSHRYKFEFVKQYFEEQGCELLSTEYSDSKSHLDYICNCGKKSRTLFSDFRQGKRCKSCGIKKISDSHRYTFEFVKQYFEEQGCELLSTEYSDSKSHLDYICNCGNTARITFNCFKRGQRCFACGCDRNAESRSHSFEYVKQCFEEAGCKLLSKKYSNCKSLLRYVCKCGNESKIRFRNFLSGARCWSCGVKKRSETMSHTFEYVRQYFDEEKCKLLAKEYVNVDTQMPYICKCGSTATINFNKFKSGIRCPKCKPRSKGEKAICEWLEKEHVLYEPEYVVPELGHKRFDFKVEELLLEYQGKQHYEPYGFNSKERFAKEKALISNIQRDYNKLQWCRKNNISLLLIPFWDYNRIPEILDDVLAGRTPTFSDPHESVKKHEPHRKKIRDRLGITETEILCGLIKQTASRSK